jgi:formylglycine-generating enzyme required for sulfatase activity
MLWSWTKYNQWILVLSLGSSTTSCLDRKQVAASPAPHVSPVGSAAPHESTSDPVRGMVHIPAGSLTIGSNDNQSNSGPTRKVALKAFFLDRTEVTVASYTNCVGAGVCSAVPPGETIPKSVETHCNWGKLGKEEHPMNCVDWNQAFAYCHWQHKRLPTEEEWEYAARGTDGRQFPWGNEAPSDQLCWDKDEHNVPLESRQGTCKVGTFPQGNSPFGIANMAGNVREWTSSIWRANSNQAHHPDEDRVIRGGSWYYTFDSIISTQHRAGQQPTSFGFDLGFRCAR